MAIDIHKKKKRKSGTGVQVCKSQLIARPLSTGEDVKVQISAMRSLTKLIGNKKKEDAAYH